MKILVTYYTQTRNTEKIAQGIFEALSAQGHDAQLEMIERISPDALGEYGLIFVGSACHDSDLAQPMRRFLKGIPKNPPYALAGFVTHATYTDEGGKREQELYEHWAGKCIESFHQVCEAKGIDFLGYFHCQGAPTPEIAAFIHRVIVTEEEEWKEYKAEVDRHPTDEDIQSAKEFAHDVLLKWERISAKSLAAEGSGHSAI